MRKLKEALDKAKITGNRKPCIAIVNEAKELVDTLPSLQYPPLFVNPEDTYLWYRVRNEEELSAIQISFFCTDADAVYKNLYSYPAWILVRVTDDEHGNILTKDEVIGLFKQYPWELEDEIKRAMEKHLKEYPQYTSSEAQEISRASENPVPEYSIASPEKLRQICIDHNWFTGGSNEQYAKLFQKNAENAPLDLIAGIIWLCSGDDLGYIKSELEKERKAYLVASQPEKYFALRLSVLEEKQYAVKAVDLKSAQDILLKAYNAGAVDMCGENTERSVEAHWSKDDQEYIDACGVGEYATILR